MSCSPPYDNHKGIGFAPNVASRLFGTPDIVIRRRHHREGWCTRLFHVHSIEASVGSLYEGHIGHRE